MAHYKKRKKKHLWFLRTEEGVRVYAVKPRTNKPSAAYLHSMCWAGFFDSFRAKLRVGEAIRIPVGDEVARFTPRPPKRRKTQRPGAWFFEAVRDAYEELIGRFMQGPPLPPRETVRHIITQPDTPLVYTVGNAYTTSSSITSIDSRTVNTSAPMPGMWETAIDTGTGYPATGTARTVSA